jgi:hypothetical protein
MPLPSESLLSGTGAALEKRALGISDERCHHGDTETRRKPGKGQGVVSTVGGSRWVQVFRQQSPWMKNTQEEGSSDADGKGIPPHSCFSPCLRGEKVFRSERCLAALALRARALPPQELPRINAAAVAVVPVEVDSVFADGRDLDWADRVLIHR